MRSLRFIQHKLWCACALYAVFFATSGCEQFDPVRTKNLCDGPAPISMRCPQCLKPKFSFKCSECQNGEADAAVCEPDPGMGSVIASGSGGDAPKAGKGESGSEGGEGGAGEGGAGASGTDGGDGQAGESGSGGMTPVGGQGGNSSTPTNQCGELWCSLNDPQHPHCDTVRQRCVECTDNSQCPGGVCNQDVGRCQNCIVNSDCSSNACDESAHVCVDCKQDVDCQAGDPKREKGSCDKQTFSCVDCVDNKGCPDPVRGTCATNTFTCVDCLTNADCEKAMPACDPMTRACVQCMVNDDCVDPVLGSCDKPNHRCVDCVDDTGCKTGTNTRCAMDTFKCVQCVEDSHCASQHCYAQKCVECEADANCDSSDKARCDLNTHACAACTDDSQCERFDDTPVCFEGTCVECKDDSTCGANSCIRSKHTCSDVPRQSLDVCQPCEADSMCKTSMQCVGLTFGNQSVGSNCVWTRNTRPSRSCNNAQPYARALNARSIDGASAADYCVPPSTTTCKGVLDVSLGASGATCKVDADCGLPGVSDGHCVDSSRCTYVCGSEGDDVNCPVGLHCLTNGLCG
ncbi:MAG TPA: hypothetical protein VJV78_13850 [Polyangiales bacterium]|nr:hypothetical protein [Polyangiales bacterium]